MMKKRWISTIVLALMLCITCTVGLSTQAQAATVAEGYCGADGDILTWVLDDSGTLTISGTGKMRNGGYSPSTGYAPWHGHEENIKHLVIESGVTNVGTWAFMDCSNLETVILGNTITTIQMSAFSGCSSMVSIDIPNSVTSIGHSAFSGCKSLSEVILGNHLTTIGGRAFNGCSSLTDIVIPDTVTSIGDSAFSGCIRLSRIVLSEGITSIGDHAFAYCSSLTSITLPESATNIGAYLFSGCSSLSSVKLPSGLTTLPKGMFSECDALISVTLPNQIAGIGAHAFDGCSNLARITIPDSVTSIGEYAFSNCESLSTVTMGKRVERIDYGAFEYCTNLTSFYVPASVTSLSPFVCSGCDSLVSFVVDANNPNYWADSFGVLYNKEKTNLLSYTVKIPGSYVIPDGVTTICRSAFFACDSLTGITIPADVTTIDTWAFYCSGLTQITFKGNAPSIAEDAFTDVTATAYYPNNATWPTSARQDYDGDITWRSYCNHSWDEATCTLPKTCSVCGETDGEALGHDPDENSKCSRCGHIGGKCGENVTWKFDAASGKLTISGTGDMYDYYSNPNLPPWHNWRENIICVVVEDGVTSVGEYAFYTDYGNLISVTIGNDVTSIGKKAFMCCSGLTTVTLGDDVTSLGISVFDHCTSLTSINIPGTITSIPECTFWNCSSLEEIVLPDGVTSIGKQAFAGCSSLKNINIPDGIAYLGVAAFSGCSSLTSIAIPESLANISESAFADCTSLKSVEIADGVTSIGAYAFDYCSSLTDVTIPGSVTSLGDFSFGHCSSLKKIVFKADAPSMDGVVFLDVMATAYYPADNATWTAYVMRNYGGTITWRVCCCENPDWELATCTTPETCKNCKFTYGEALGHAYPATGTHTEGDCKTYGYTTYVCGNGCGIDKVENDTVYGDHNYPAEGTHTEGDCKTYGFTTYVCNNGCGINKVVDDTAYGDHDWTDADCDTPKTCSVCRETDGEALGHDPDENYKCSRCGHIGGKCGENVTWEFDEVSGKLTISGTGAMYDFDKAPWFAYSPSIKSAVIDEGVTTLGSRSFEAYDALASISIPSTLTQIGNYAFKECSRLHTINFPENSQLISIGEYAFSGSGIWDIEIPASVSTIGFAAFYKCRQLGNVQFAESSQLQKFAQYTFDNSGLKNITLPGILEQLQTTVFQGCTRLQTITFQSDAPSFYGDVFGGLTITAYYPVGNSTWTDAVKQNYGGTITWVAQCCNNPDWQDATCETPKTCKNCNTTDGEALGHLFAEGICTGCGISLAGDMDRNGEVSAEDLTLLARHVAGIEVLTDATALDNADVNNDGNIDANDLTMLARYVAGIIEDWT